MRAKVRTEFLISCHQGAFLVKKLRTEFLISCHQGAFLVKKRPYYSSDTKNRQNREMQKSHQKLLASKWKYFFLKKVILILVREMFSPSLPNSIHRRQVSAYNRPSSAAAVSAD